MPMQIALHVSSHFADRPEQDQASGNSSGLGSYGGNSHISTRDQEMTASIS